MRFLRILFLSFLLTKLCLFSLMVQANNQAWLPVIVYSLLEEGNIEANVFPRNDSVSILENQGVEIDVLANDQPLVNYVPQIYSHPSHGTITLTASGINYIPHYNYYGADSFRYRIASNNGEVVHSDIAIVSININEAPRGASPVAINDSIITIGDGLPVIHNLLFNDTDADNNIVGIADFSQPSNGSVTQITNGAISYLPNSGYCGTDSFFYTVKDSRENIATAAVNISCDNTYIPQLSPPAILQSIIEVNAPLNVMQEFVVVNNTYALDSNYPLKDLFIVMEGEHSESNLQNIYSVETDIGKFTVHNHDGWGFNQPNNYKGKVLYVADKVSNGNGIIDSVKYRLRNPDGTYSETIGELKVSLDGSHNQDYGYTPAPDLVMIEQNKTIDINVLANDPNVQSYFKVEVYNNPLHGKVSINADFSIQYTPDEYYQGEDSFSYRVLSHNLEELHSAPATVSINIARTNLSPIAIDDEVITLGDGAPVLMNVIANDSDPEGNFIYLLKNVGSPAHGTAKWLSNTSIKYTPTPGYCGNDSFTYVVSQDPQSILSDIGTVIVTCDTPPVAVNDSLTIGLNSVVVTLNVIANDTDLDGDFLSLLTVGSASFGQVRRISNTSIEYSKTVGTCENDSFTYVVTDATSGGKTATGTVMVSCSNSALALTGTPITSINAGQNYSFTPTSVGVENPLLTFSITNKPTWAIFDAQTGRLSGVPQAQDEGATTNIIISVTDGLITVSLPSFTIEVNASMAEFTSTITSPITGSQLTVGDVMVSAVSSNIENLQEIQFSLDGTNWLSDIDGVAPWQYNFTTLTLGQHNLFARAVSITGELSNVAQVNINVVTGELDTSGSYSATGGTIEDATLTVPEAPDTATTAVGSIAGSGGVSGGAAHYSIPITIAPGRNGVAPSVALSYSSRGGNGIAGVGWSLSATSVISRCAATVAQDGIVHNVQYDKTNDRLCLDGQRLILADGAYGFGGAHYRTEIDTFVNVIQIGDLNDADVSFTAQYKNGTTAYFGREANSRNQPDGAPAVLSWHIDQQHDITANNFIDYQYYPYGGNNAHGEGELLIEDIYYTGNTADTQGNRRINFTYAPRSDTSVSYLSGGKSEFTQQLTQITSYYKTSKIRQYTLTTEQSLSTGRALLKSVKECGYEGESNVELCLPETSFSWYENEIGFSVEKLAYTGTVLEDATYLLDIMPKGDVDGNGVLDFPEVLINAEGDVVGSHTNNFDECPKNIALGIRTCIAFDADMDGKTDSHSVQEDKLTIFLTASNTSFTSDITLSNGAAYATDSIVHTSDYNGDGYTDLVIYQYNASRGGELKLYLHTTIVNAPYENNGEVIYTYAWESIGDDAADKTLMESASFVGDIDGNGYDDMLISKTMVPYYNTYISIPGNIPDKILLGQGDSVFIEKDVDFGLPDSPGEIGETLFIYSQFIDINGDGLSDWLGWLPGGSELYTRINNGKAEFGEPILITGNPGMLTRDFSPFKHPDSDSGITVFVPKFGESIKIADIDLNGQPEIIIPGTRKVSGCAGVWVPKGGTMQEVEHCGNALYGRHYSQYTVHNIPIALANGVPGEYFPDTLIDVGRLDDSLYQYDAIHFDIDSSGDTLSINARRESTSMIGSATQSTILDVFGDGLPDMLFTYGARQFNWIKDGETTPAGIDKVGTYLSRNLGAAAAEDVGYKPMDNLAQVSNGVGHVSQWQYSPLSSDISSAGADIYETDHAVVGNGYIHFASSMYVVSSFKQSNGLSSLNETQYGYRDAMYNLLGRGFMGFKEIIVQDVTQSTYAYTNFSQEFPYQSKVLDHAIFGSSAALGTLDIANAFSHTKNTWERNAAHVGVISNSAIEHIYLTQSVNTKRDLSSNSVLTTTTQSITDIDAWGNVTSSETEVDDVTGIIKTTVVNVFESDESTWWLNKLMSSTKSSPAIIKPAFTAFGGATDGLNLAHSVKTDFEYTHATLRKPTKVTISPTDSSKASVVDTVYNDYGLPTSVSQVASAMSSKGVWASQTRNVSAVKYSNDGTTVAVDGYFPYEITNAKGHLSYLHSAPKTGLATKTRKQLSSGNYFDTLYHYDGLGRAIEVNVAGSPAQYIRYTDSDTNAPTYAVLQITTTQAGMPTQKVYKDQFGRTLRSAIQDFANSWVLSDQNYDAKGNLTFTSTPSLTNAAEVGVRYSGHDVLGRPGSKTTHQACGNLVSTYTYLGLTTQIAATDYCENQTINMSRTYNSVKQLVSTVTETNAHADVITRYAYNSQGNPIVIRDAQGNSIVAHYNDLGQKTSVDDPNQGSTSFSYNGFGELQQETRANGTIITYLMDSLGRVTARYATGESTLSYQYDTADYGYGQLASESGNGVTRAYEFDNLGRATKTNITAVERDYTIETRYDANYGRIKGIVYPNDLTLKFAYNSRGYQTNVSNAASGYVYREITAQDAFGNISLASLGNGVDQMGNYSARNGQVSYLSFMKDNQNLLNLAYDSYDGFGNLKTMTVTDDALTQVNEFTESYEYDDLHRLTSNHVNNIEIGSYTYDAIGNILSKSDYADSYVYDDFYGGFSSGGPNAVKGVQINSEWHGFDYDARGNMIAGYGLDSAAYNAMDKPTAITKSGTTLAFTYGPNQLRAKQTRSTSGVTTTTYYADKLYEEEVVDGKVSWRAYIADIAIVSQTENQSARISYTHRDRLGSARLFTDASGNKQGNLRNFDPFGKLRTPTGQVKETGSAKLDDLELSRRGFTDHEHLDEVEFIHMNGRVYDYNLGRFLSVDPFVQSPGNSQSLNPYSYIMNNPLSGTDPTGYCSAATGTRIKSCGDMKVDVKVDGNTVGSAVVKDVNFRSSASVNGALNQGASMVGKAFSASSSTADIGSPANTNATTQPNNGSSTLSNIGDTIKGVAQAGAKSLRKGGGIGLALTPMETATDEQMEDLVAPVMAENKAKTEEKQTALLTQIRTRVDKDGYVTSYKAPTKDQLVKVMAQGGFSPDEFPNLGAFFTLDPITAGGYANARGAGVSEVKTSFKIMESLIQNGHLSYDPLERSSFSVYPQGLPRFNSGSQIRHIQSNSYELYDDFNAQ